jgi:hypothetical protein
MWCLLRIAPLSVEDQNQAALDRVACQVSAACEKYDKARIDCATAGNFKTCLRIKMGDDERYGRYCTNGYDEGAPPMRSPGSPYKLTCAVLLKFGN